MKILIIVPKEKDDALPDYNTFFPIGLGYICATLKRARYQYDVINLNYHFGLLEENLFQTFNKKKYDIICLGGSLKNFHIIEKIIRMSRKASSHSHIILGGLILNYKPEMIYNKLKPTVGVIGEGEDTIIEILEYYTGRRSIESVKGIIYSNKSGDVIKSPPRQAPQNIDQLPFPDFESLGIKETFEKIHTNSSYLSYSKDVIRSYPIVGSRSCPYRCTFCSHISNFRQRSLDNIISELDYIVPKYKINMINMYDETMRPNRIQAFARYMIDLNRKEKREIHWTCVLRVDVINNDILSLLKESKCVSICYGIESFDQRVLNSMNKMITTDQIEYALTATLQHNIAIFGHFIFGDPVEDDQSIRTTIDFWKKHPGQINIHFLKPYPGSSIYKTALDNGIITNELDYLIHDMFKENTLVNITNFSKKKYRREMGNLLCIQRKLSPFVIPKITSVKNRKSYIVKIKCPHCKEVISYNNFEMKIRIPRISFKTFVTRCRNCAYRFYVGGILEKIVFKTPLLSKALNFNIKVYSK